MVNQTVFCSKVVAKNCVSETKLSCLYKQKQHPIGVLIKKCSENMQQIYRRTSISQCDFNKVAKQFYRNHTPFSCNLLHIFRAPFPKNITEELLLCIQLFNCVFIRTVFRILPNIYDGAFCKNSCGLNTVNFFAKLYRGCLTGS